MSKVLISITTLEDDKGEVHFDFDPPLESEQYTTEEYNALPYSHRAGICLGEFIRETMVSPAGQAGYEYPAIEPEKF